MSKTVIDRNAQQEVDVSSADAQQAVLRGDAALTDETQTVVKGGQLMDIPTANLGEAVARGWTLVDDEEASAVQLRNEESDAASLAIGAGEALASGLSLGLYSSAAEALGADPERMSARREALGDLGTAAEIGGAALPALFSGGASLAGTAGGTAARGGARAFLRATPAGLLERGAGAIESRAARALAEAPGLVRTTVPVAGRGAVEGFVSGAGAQLHEDVLGDREVSVDRLLGAGGMGAILGGGIGALVPGVSAAALAGTKLPREAASKVLRRATGIAEDIAVSGQSSLLEQALADGNASKIAKILGVPEDSVSTLLPSLRTREGREDLGRLIDSHAEYEQDIAKDFVAPVTDLRSAIVDMRSSLSRKNKVRMAGDKIPEEMRPAAIESASARLDEFDAAIDDALAQNAELGGEFYDDGALMYLKKRAQAARGSIAGASSGAGGDVAALFRDNDMVSDLIAPTRPLENFHKAFEGATPQQIDDIAMGKRPTMNGQPFEPVRITYQPGEEGFDPIVLSMGNHRLASAKAAGAKRFMAEVHTPDGKVYHTPIRIDGGQSMTDAALTSAAAGKAYGALDELKQDADLLLKRMRSDPTTKARNTMDVLAGDSGLITQIRKNLEDEGTWGEMGAAQRDMNSRVSYAARLASSPGDSAAKRILDTRRPDVDNADVLSIVRQSSRWSGEQATERFRNRIQAEIDAAEAVARHSDLTPDQAMTLDRAKKALASWDDVTARQKDKVERAQAIEMWRNAEGNRSVSIGALSSPATVLAPLIGGAVGGLPGAAVGYAASLATKPYTLLRRYTAIMRQIDKGEAGQIAAVAGFVRKMGKGAAKAARAAAPYGAGVGRAARSAAIRGTAISAAKRRERNDAALEKAQYYASNPGALAEDMRSRTLNIEDIAPSLSGLAAQRAGEAAAFLASKAPQRWEDPLGRVSLVNPHEQAKFDRYADAVLDPLSVLGHLENGTFTLEHAEALRTVYPAMYADIQRRVMEAMIAAPKIPFQSRVQAGILFESPTDASMRPEMIAATQAAIAGPTQQSQEPAQPKLRASGSPTPKSTAAYSTGAGRIESGASRLI
jgi:hypothetical protein